MLWSVGSHVETPWRLKGNREGLRKYQYVCPPSLPSLVFWECVIFCTFFFLNDPFPWGRVHFLSLIPDFNFVTTPIKWFINFWKLSLDHGWCGTCDDERSCSQSTVTFNSNWGLCITSCHEHQDKYKHILQILEQSIISHNDCRKFSE